MGVMGDSSEAISCWVKNMPAAVVRGIRNRRSVPESQAYPRSFCAASTAK
jgi:hypothetical protein